MPTELEQLKQRVASLELQINFLVRADRYLFHRDIEMLEGRNIRLSGNTGTKIGTATTQKLGFYNKTPIVQPGAIAAPSSPSGTYSQSEAQSTVTAVNSIRTTLTNLGLTA